MTTSATLQTGNDGGAGGDARTTQGGDNRTTPAGDVRSTSSAGLDGRTFAIGVLSVTACVLFVGLILVLMMPTRTAYAANQNDRAGDYILLTQQLTTSTEAVVVIDVPSNRLIMYAFDYNNRRMDIVDGIKLDELRRGETAPDASTKKGRKP